MYDFYHLGFRQCCMPHRCYHLIMFLWLGLDWLIYLWEPVH